MASEQHNELMPEDNNEVQLQGGPAAADAAQRPGVDEAAVAKVTRMGTESVGRLLIEFMIPALASVIISALYNVIDSIFLGRAIGEIGLAATTVAGPVMTVMFALSMFAGQGGNSLCAILLGEGRHSDAEKTLGNTITVMIIMSVIVAAFAASPLLDPVLRFVGATDRTLPASHMFVQIILFGMMISNVSVGVNNFIRTAGAPNLALWTVLVGTILCIVFNYLFVMCWGWGVAGSAFATLLGQAISAIWVLWYFMFSKKAPFRLRAGNLRIDPVICRRLLTLGLAPFALQVAASVCQVVGNVALAHWGALDPMGTDAAMASIGVAMKITGFIVFPVIGISIAAQPILGFNVGARKYDRVLRCLAEALLAGTGVLLALFILIHVIPEQLVGLFGVEDKLMDFSVYALKVQTIFIPVISIQIIGSNYFQATGQPFKSMLLSLTRQLIFTLPMYFIAPVVIPMLFPGTTNLMGLCFVFPISDILAVVLCAVFLTVEIRRLRRLIREQKEGLADA